MTYKLCHPDDVDILVDALAQRNDLRQVYYEEQWQDDSLARAPIKLALPALKKLVLNNANIGDLDLGSLEHLSFYRCTLPASFIERLSRNRTITELSFDGGINLFDLSRALQGNRVLKQLGIDVVDENDATLFAKLFSVPGLKLCAKRCGNILTPFAQYFDRYESLVLEDYRSYEYQPFIEALVANRSLEKLDLNLGHWIPEEDTKSLLEAVVRTHPNLDSLWIGCRTPTPFMTRPWGTPPPSFFYHLTKDTRLRRALFFFTSATKGRVFKFLNKTGDHAVLHRIADFLFDPRAPLVVISDTE